MTTLLCYQVEDGQVEDLLMDVKAGQIDVLGHIKHCE